MGTVAAIDWDEIDTVLLDMDGTLLDLRFDNWFWQEHVPGHYGAVNGMELREASAILRARFHATRGTLQWYCIDHWSRELDLDIAALKRTAASNVDYLPGAVEFLTRLGGLGVRRALVTNAHPTTLAIKDEVVGLTPYFDAVYSTHAFACPKENPRFWPRLQAREPFAPTRTLFVDDSLAVLDSAQGFGIGWIRAIRRPDSGLPAQDTGRHAGVDRIGELL